MSPTGPIIEILINIRPMALQIWTMDVDGSNKQQIDFSLTEVEMTKKEETLTFN